MKWDRVHVWTRTLYAIVHSLHMAKELNFGDQETLDRRFREAGEWINPNCSYASTLLDHDSGGMKLTFRKDPNDYFPEIAGQLIKMLIQDLAVIFDELMTDALSKLEMKAGNYPQSKVEKLATLLHVNYKWSELGCLELIAVRNVLCHAGGTWNARSVDIISSFMTSPPHPGEKLVIGFEMLFHYRKAMRTFLNQVCHPEKKPTTRAKKNREPSRRTKKRELKLKRKESIRQAMNAI